MFGSLCLLNVYNERVFSYFDGLNTRTSMIKTNVSIVLLFRDNCGKATSVHQKPVCTTATTMAPVHIPVNANATKHGWATVAKLVPARTPAMVRSVFFNPLPQSPNPTDQSYRSILPINPTDQSYRVVVGYGTSKI